MPKNDPKLIQITRHIAGPPRRAPGQVLSLTPEQVKAQGLKRGDFRRYVDNAAIQRNDTTTR